MYSNMCYYLSFVCMCLIVFAPVAGLAQDTGQEKKITNVEGGQAAPFSGILLSPMTYIQMQKDHEYEIKKQDIKHDQKVELIKLEHKYENQALKDKIEMMKQADKTEDEMYEEQIDYYKSQAKSGGNGPVLLVIGFATGVLITGGSVFAGSQLSK